jgi:hypothetical protein
VSAAVALFACGFATARFGGGLEMPGTTTMDEVQITLSRYLREPVPDIVLVGSSLTKRLKEEYFAVPRLRNLALAGGSPVTGMEIVANQPRLPGIVVVEANILNRRTDAELVERYSRAETAPLFFRPVRTAVAVYEQRRHPSPTREQIAIGLRELIARPPSDFDNRAYIDLTRQQYDSEDPTGESRSNSIRIGQLIRNMEQRGARVVLFEVPYAEPVEHARFTVVTREIIHAAFPDPKRWLPVDVNRAELRWTDGAHLDERSAVIVAQALERAMMPAR